MATTAASTTITPAATSPASASVTLAAPPAADARQSNGSQSLEPGVMDLPEVFSARVHKSDFLQCPLETVLRYITSERLSTPC